MYQIHTAPISGIKIITHIDRNVRTSFMEDPQNTDYQRYLAWLADGNEPEIIEG